MVQDNTVNFLYTISGKHKQFILPFIYFAAKYNKPNATFEFYITDGCIDENTKNGIDFLRNIGIKNININVVNLYNGIYYRYLVSPKKKCRYTYMGDIDIMITENIVDHHVENMKKSGAIFDNIKRDGQDRLSGLHFVETYPYYMKTKKVRDYLDGLLRQGKVVCEGKAAHMLFYICKESKLKIPQLNDRPEHGFHISLNRKPFKQDSKLSIGLTNPEYKKEFLKTIKEDNFIRLLKYCPEFKTTLITALKYLMTGGKNENLNKFNRVN